MIASYVARLGSVWLRALGKGPAGVLEEIRFPLRIWLSDIDVNLHVNNGRYLTLMDNGRFVFMVRTGMLSMAAKRGWAPVVGAATVYFLRELRALERVELTTRLAGYDSKWMYFEHRLEKDGVAHAVAVAKIIVKHKGRTVPPAEVLAALGYLGEAPALPEYVQRWIEVSPRP